MNVRNELMSIEDVNVMINSGRVLIVAGEEQILSKLNKGNWVGGTTPYFMNHEGGVVSQEKIFVTDFTDYCIEFKIGAYKEDQILEQMLTDRYNNGFTYVLLPAFSAIHEFYALKNHEASNLFDVPTVGWIMGVHMDEIGKKSPKVINGKTGTFFDDTGLALHCQLREEQYAELDLINIYEQGDGDVIIPLEDAFSCGDCLINGKRTNLADYYIKNKIDASLPLIANYSGASINVSVQALDEENKKVVFFAPLLSAKEYRVAKPVSDLYKGLVDKLPEDTSSIVCSFNCMFNYLNLELNGKILGNFRGPFTFGEIAYVLVNQTMVTLAIHDES